MNRGSSSLRYLLRKIGTAGWIRLGVRRRIVSALYPSETAKPTPFNVPFHGVRYRGNIATAQEWHVYFFGGYELKELALINDILKSLGDAVALDIGANLGGHSLVMSSLAREVHCFEPFPPLADRIEDQIVHNKISNISVHRFGLGEREEVKPYFLDETSRNSGTGSFLREHTGSAEAGRLQLRKGDDWAGDRKIDFIKIDVEGFEAPALKGLEATLLANEPIILMEVTESGWNNFANYGGLDAVIPYGRETFEVRNPNYPLGVFQKGGYRLLKLSQIVPRRGSFNVLLVPASRAVTLAPILRSATTD